LKEDRCGGRGHYAKRKSPYLAAEGGELTSRSYPLREEKNVLSQFVEKRSPEGEKRTTDYISWVRKSHEAALAAEGGKFSGGGAAPLSEGK